MPSRCIRAIKNSSRQAQSGGGALQPPTTQLVSPQRFQDVVTLDFGESP